MSCPNNGLVLAPGYAKAWQSRVVCDAKDPSHSADTDGRHGDKSVVLIRVGLRIAHVEKSRMNRTGSRILPAVESLNQLYDSSASDAIVCSWCRNAMWSVVKRAFGAGKLTLVVCCSTLVAACSATTSSSNSTGQTPLNIDDGIEKRIAELVYNPDYAAPAGFLIDSRADTVGSYTIHHVKDESASFELCTDSSQQAEVLESLDNASRSVSGELVEIIETEKYFEFVRYLQYPDSFGNVAGETSPGFARVFKCSFVDRSGVDRNLRDGYGGKFNAVPLDGASVKSFVEYLWQFTFFWPAQEKVVSTRTEELDSAIQHTLSIAFKYNQGFQRCDRIELVDWSFSINRADGAISRVFNPLLVFEAEDANGEVRICDQGQLTNAAG